MVLLDRKLTSCVVKLSFFFLPLYQKNIHPGDGDMTEHVSVTFPPAGDSPFLSWAFGLDSAT